jgi:signal transduction histidine kinase
MRNLIPDTLATRTLLVLIIGLMSSHVFSIALYLTDRSSALRLTGGEHTGERIATVWRLVKDASQAERQRIVELADYPKLHLFWSQESAIEDQQDSDWEAGVLRDALIAHLNGLERPLIRLRHTDGVGTGAWERHLRQDHQDSKLGEALLVSFQSPDGSWLNFAAPVKPAEPFWSLRFVLSLAVMLLAVGVLSAVVAHRLARPLETFSRAAQRLGTDVKSPPISESGPAEVRQAIRAFNQMQERIRRFVEDRTQMLVAISHDLGTPITRLRLRAELIEDKDQQKKMLADLDDMEKMIFSVMSFARNESADDAHAMVDLKSLLQRVCDEMADAGHSIALGIGDNSVAVRCRPAALRRALTNLLDNAIKYGRQAHVYLDHHEQEVRIRIDDDGPGIPEELQDQAFKAFQRLDASRSRETGGTGLGLTVARTIVRAHGGDVTLTNRAEGGLRVEVTLPR